MYVIILHLYTLKIDLKWNKHQTSVSALLQHFRTFNYCEIMRFNKRNPKTTRVLFTYLREIITVKTDDTQRSRLRAKPHSVYLWAKCKPQNCTQCFWILSVANWCEVVVTECNFKSKTVEIAQLNKEDWGTFHSSSYLPFLCQFVNLENPFADQCENKNKWKTYLSYF